jgi:hypothetical protein
MDVSGSILRAWMPAIPAGMTDRHLVIVSFLRFLSFLQLIFESSYFAFSAFFAVNHFPSIRLEPSQRRYHLGAEHFN